MTLKYWFFSFKGRIGRFRWWVAIFVVFAVFFLSEGVLLHVRKISHDISNVFIVLVVIGLCWISAAVSCKRFHDLGHSVLGLVNLFLIQIVGGLMIDAANMQGVHDKVGLMAWIGTFFILVPVVYLGFFPGKKGANRFGADPRTRAGKAHTTQEHLHANSTVSETPDRD